MTASKDQPSLPCWNLNSNKHDLFAYRFINKEISGDVITTLPENCFRKAQSRMPSSLSEDDLSFVNTKRGRLPTAPQAT